MSELDKAMAQFEGDFVESADLMNSKPVTLTITGVVPPNTEKDATNRLIDKPIFSFKEARKRMIVGKTNERIIKSLFGRTASGWIGHEVSVGVRYLKEAFGQHNVPTLRFIFPPGTPVPFSVMKHYGKDTPWE